MGNYNLNQNNNGRRPTPNDKYKNYLSIPSLPSNLGCNLNSITSLGPWVDQYIEYANCISPLTPSLFHESAALWLASIAIARRAVVNMPFGKVFPNLYVIWS